MDPRQQQAAAAIQKMAQVDPEFVKMQKLAEMKAFISEQTSRCWERNVPNVAIWENKKLIPQ